MIDKKHLTELLFKNLGLFGLITGIAFIIFGIINLGTIPYYYESISGDLARDSQFTVLTNIFLWFVFCFLLMQIGVKFYFNSVEVEKIEVTEQRKDSIHFCLIGAFIVCGLMVYLILLLIGVVYPLQFYPHVLFAGEESLMDLSIFFNTIIFFVLILVIYRVGRKFVKYGLKIGEIK